jgi:hypothetical protein
MECYRIKKKNYRFYYYCADRIHEYNTTADEQIIDSFTISVHLLRHILYTQLIFALSHLI